MGSAADERGCDMKPKVRLKRGSRGWFAAGPGFERALGRLSDAAFKVFAYVCLRAGRADGCLEFERDGLAREVGKSRSTLGRCLRELAAKGVCEWEAAPNQHRRSWLRVRPEYWPYEVQAEAAGQEPDPQSLGLGQRCRQSRMSPKSGGCSGSRRAYRACSGRLTSAWRRTGTEQECRWRRCAGRFCWAVSASR